MSRITEVMELLARLSQATTEAILGIEIRLTRIEERVARLEAELALRRDDERDEERPLQ